jgi:excisionase family DNA binding protein
MSRDTERATALELQGAYSALITFYRYTSSDNSTRVETIRDYYSEVLEKAFAVMAVCKWCEEPTPDTSTRLCGRCKELVDRIEQNPRIVKLMLDDHAPEPKGSMATELWPVVQESSEYNIGDVVDVHLHEAPRSVMIPGTHRAVENARLTLRGLYEISDGHAITATDENGVLFALHLDDIKDGQIEFMPIQGRPEAGPFSTIFEVAERLQLNPKTIRRFIGRKELPALKLGHAWRISEIDLQGFINQRRNCAVEDEHTPALAPGADAEPHPKVPEAAEAAVPEPSVRLSPGEVAHQLSVSPATIYRCLKEGLIPSQKVGRNMFVDRTGLINFLDDNGYRNGGAMLPPKYWKTGEAAAFVGVGSETLTMLARTGNLKAVHIRKSWRFLPEDLQRFKDAQRDLEEK